MKRISKYVIIAIVGGFFLNSCSSDDDINEPVDPRSEGEYSKGFFVLNEGNFGNNNSSLSFVNNDFSNPEIEIFSTVNGTSLGDTGQYMALYNDYAFVVMNASNIIQVVNRYTLELLHTIEEGLSNPRELIVYDDNIYVTNWGDGSDSGDDYVAIYDLENYEATGTISVGEGPESIIAENDKLYVALKGGINYNDQVVVIDPTSNTVEQSIEVGVVPNSLEVSNGILWVMSGGVPGHSQDLDESPGSISRIELSNNQVISEMIFPNSTDHPSNFEIEEDTFYYTLNGSVYSMETSATDLPEDSLFNFADFTFLYGFEVEDEYFYTADAGNFTSNGKVKIYNLEGELITEFDSGGIGPNGFYFND